MKNLPERRIRPSGFTLVELLVVMAIIAILAGLIVYALPLISEKKVRGRVKTELAMLVMAVNNYKAKFGFYPPDNANDTARSQLFYELTGTKRTIAANGNPFFMDIYDGALQTNEIGAYFGTSGFLNSGDERQNLLSGLKSAASKTYQAAPSDPEIRLLVVPYKGPGGDFNPWRYTSSNPQHNPEGFDLWAEVVIGNKTIVLGNWKE